MYRHKVVWVLACLPQILSFQVSWMTDPYINLENVAGKLVFYQNEGSATFVRDTGELASDVPTVAMFEISDPENALRTTKFTYTWDFGNGEVIQGTEPVVRYNYSESGNYTLRLRIGGNETKYATPISGIYSMDLKVLDAIKNIELKGPSDYHVSEKTSLVFHVDGSPPMWVCWQILPDCGSEVTPAGCTATTLNGSSLHLDHTFTSTGVYCLDISAHNDISKLQASYSLYVRRHRYSNLLFILPCVAVLVATFAFITVSACRPRRHNSPMVVASCNAIFLSNQGSDGSSNIQFTSFTAEQGENQPLLLQDGTQYSF
ncbi:transmembrane protein 130 [Polymixia lowei]